MTPAERTLVTELFDRLATLEDAERDPEAERLIRDGLRQAPNAPYSLVQTVLVQDEALKRADARIRELEQELGIGAEAPRPAGFLDNMRDALLGRREEPRAGSVPSLRSSDSPWGAQSGFRAGAQPIPEQPMPQEPMRPGGSFLGTAATAAAAAAGVIGGSMLMNSMRSMMGPGHGGSSAFDQGSAGGAGASSPWSGSEGGNLSREAGLDDIGRGSAGSAGRDGGDSGGRQGLFDTASNDAEENIDADDFDDGGFDLGGGDSDTA
jgi:hypothetical protein